MMTQGGMQTSTNDQTSVSNHLDAAFGGLNVNNGIKTEWVVGGVVVIALVWLLAKGKR